MAKCRCAESRPEARIVLNRLTQKVECPDVRILLLKGYGIASPRTGFQWTIAAAMRLKPDARKL